MQIILKNEYGELVIGCNGGAKLLSISGLGIVQKETQKVTYSGQPGQTTLSMRDMPRAITMKIDFKGNQDLVMKLYRMIYSEINITIISGDQRRTTKGLCTNASDVEQIIFHRMYSIALQFVCDDPYFHDITSTTVSAFQRIDNFPNLIEDGQAYLSLPAVATTRKTNTQVLNKGAIKIYPVFEITNNTDTDVSDTETGLVITNNTTGVAITIDRNMKSSEKITIDLPYRKIVSNIDGSIISYISNDTVLSNFYLDIGLNDITITNKNTNQLITAIIKYNNNYEAVAI